MKNIMNKPFFIVIAIVLLLASWFYWFQLRPANIRHECSWINNIGTAVPAQPAITKQEADNSMQQFNKCKSQFSEYRTWEDKLNEYRNHKTIHDVFGVDSCWGLIKKESPAMPAKPEGVWYSPANSDQYKFCIQSHGL